jgi:hypothetical protein
VSAKTHFGSCHCGAVRFEADLDLTEGTTRCNCSSCAKGRAWFVFAKGAESFRLKSGKEALTDYQWTPPGKPHGGLTFAFCKVCGVRAYARGDLQALGGTFHAVPVATLDDVTPEEMESSPIRYVDGLHDDYTQPPANTRWL